MNDERSQFSIMNDINDIMNDKRPFPLHEQSWYRAALLISLWISSLCLDLLFGNEVIPPTKWRWTWLVSVKDLTIMISEADLVVVSTPN